MASALRLCEHEVIYCGMAPGYADISKHVNTLRGDRAEVDEIAVFWGSETATPTDCYP